MLGEDDLICQNCLYFKPGRDYDEFDLYTSGICHRYPLVQTKCGNDFCGEFDRMMKTEKNKFCIDRDHRNDYFCEIFSSCNLELAKKSSTKCNGSEKWKKK